MATRKLTTGLMRRLIAEEKASMKSTEQAAKSTKEVDADEYADALEQPVDYIKVLKIKEARLQRALKEVQKKKARYNQRNRANRIAEAAITRAIRKTRVRLERVKDEL